MSKKKNQIKYFYQILSDIKNNIDTLVKEIYENQKNLDTSLIEQNIPNQDLVLQRIKQINKNLNVLNNSLALSAENFNNEPAKQPIDPRKLAANAKVVVSPAPNQGKKATDGEPKKPTVTPQERVILDLKSENRDLKRMIKDEVIPTMREMQQQIKQGSLSKQDVKDELDALAEKYELEPEFVKELANAIKSKTTKEVEDKYLTDIKDIKADREKGKALTQEARIKQAVVSEFDRVVADNPGYAKIAKKEVITKMILNTPEYQDMAMEDVLAEVYGDIENPGMDGYTPQGSNHTAEVNSRD